MSNLSTFRAPLISGPVGTLGSSSAVPVLTLDAKGRLTVSTSPLSATNVSQFTNDAGYVTQAGVRSAISVSGSLAYNASTGVISFTFDPATKLDKAGGTFTGSVYFNGLGTNGFEIGNGDAATYATQNIKLRMHNGMALTTYDGTVQGVWDSRAAVLDVKGGFKVNGISVPVTSANATFRDVQATRGDGSGVYYFAGRTDRYLYFDSVNYVMPGAQLFVNGSQVWHTGNLDPATKVNKAGDTPTGQLVYKASATGTIASRSGDGSFLQVRADDGQGAAAMTFHRANSYATWFGLDTDNEFKFGGWSEGAVAQRFWTSKNFNPASYAQLNTNPRFTSVVIGGGEGTIYSDGSTNNIRVRSGASSAYKYAGLNDDGTFQIFNGGLDSAGSVRATGDLRTSGRVIVGEGQNLAYIEMRDTDEGTRYIHNNSGLIGFLGNAGDWIFRVGDGGAVWTKQFGDLNQRIEDRASAYAATRQANLGFTPVQQGGGANQRTNKVYLGWDGTGLRAQVDSTDLGRIFVQGQSNSLLDLRLIYAGDLGADWNYGNGVSDPYGGGVVTGQRGGAQSTANGSGVINYFVNALRYRYLQKLDSYGNWYTVAYA